MVDGWITDHGRERQTLTHPEPAELTAPDFASIQRRTIRVLMAAQIFSGAGLAAGIKVGALLAQDMLGLYRLGRGAQCGAPDDLRRRTDVYYLGDSFTGGQHVEDDLTRRHDAKVPLPYR